MQATGPAREICFLALTRPALTLGVPTWGLAINAGVCFFGGVLFSTHSWANNPFMYWLLAFPIHFAMRRLTSWDFHWVRTLMLWGLTSGIGITALHIVAAQRVKSGKGASSSA
jgi:type IV secretory pathway VirB3-like protein